MKKIELMGTSLVVVFFAAILSLAQTNQTLDKQIVEVINRKLPHLIMTKPFTMVSPQMTNNPMMHSIWKTKDRRIVNIRIWLIDSLDRRESHLRMFLVRNISPPNRSIEKLGNRAALVSMGDRWK